MTADNNQALNTGKRRDFLRTAGAGAFGLFSLPSSVQALQSGSAKVQIPIHQSGDEIVRHKEVRSDWWNYNLRARAVHEELMDRFLSRPEVAEVERSASEEKHDHFNRFKQQINVYVQKDAVGSTFASRIPSTVDGIPVTVKEAAEYVDTATDDPTDGYIHGGEQGGALDNEATVTCQVNYNGSDHLMMARHPFAAFHNDGSHPNRCETHSQKDRSCYQSGDFFGTVVNDWQQHDVLVAKLDSSGSRSGFTNRIIDQDGEIYGNMTQDRIDDFITNGSTVYKRGQTTGSTSGEILGQSGTIPCDTYSEGANINHALRTTLYQEFGDSGGPIYEEYWNSSFNRVELYIAAPATQKRTADSSARGAAAWFINQSTGVGFTN